VAIVERSLRLDPRHPDWIGWHTVMIDQVMESAGRFDVIHFHIDHLHFPVARRCKTPCVTTLHGRQDLPDLAEFYRHFREQPVVSISDGQREPLPTANWAATVHHGLPVDLYRYCPQPDDYFAFVGRISPEKRADRAIEIANACGVPLRIAAKVDAADRRYFHKQIEPLLQHPLVHYGGEIEESEKNEFIGKARALLFPIDWPEPFGLVMIEALACGTPVIAYSGGSVPEILEHGVTGYIVNDQQQAIAAARRIDRIDRRRCRQAFEERFTATVMAERYLEVYRRLRES
jgi:glycosyltransferase involved in cell wall biosynthesis